MEGAVVHVGVSCAGIALHHGNKQMVQHVWPNIVKVSYRKKKFRIRFHEARANITDVNPVRLNEFRCGEPPASKRLWKACVEQHTFFRWVLAGIESTILPCLLLIDWVSLSHLHDVRHCCYGEAQNFVIPVVVHWSKCVKPHMILKTRQSIGEWEVVQLCAINPSPHFSSYSARFGKDADSRSRSKLNKMCKCYG